MQWLDFFKTTWFTVTPKLVDKTVFVCQRYHFCWFFEALLKSSDYNFTVHQTQRKPLDHHKLRYLLMLKIKFWFHQKS